MLERLIQIKRTTVLVFLEKESKVSYYRNNSLTMRIMPI